MTDVSDFLMNKTMEISSTPSSPSWSSLSSLITMTWKVEDDSDLINVTDTAFKRQRLVQLNMSEIVRLLPLVAYLALISLLGLLGNGLVLHIYRTRYKKSNLKYFILCLSAIDLFSCVLVMPFEIYTVLHQYTFEYSTVCKIARVVNTLPTVASGFMFQAIAIDRYRKVCKPLHRQITPRLARWICGGTILCGVAFSWPAPFVYGKKTFYVPEFDSYASECSVDDSMVGQIYPLINNLTFGFLFAVGTTSLVVLYAIIGRAISKHANDGLVQSNSVEMNAFKLERSDSDKELSNSHSYAGKYSVENDRSSSLPRRKISNILSSGGDTSDILNDSNGNTNRQSYSYVDQLNRTPPAPRLNKSISIDSSSQSKSWRKSAVEKINSIKGRLTSSGSSYDVPNGTSPQNGGNSQNGTLNRVNRSRQKRARRSSILMFSITLAYILSYLPHVLLMAIRAVNKDFVDNMSNEGRATYKFFLRSWALNCVVNPFIYSACDARFKKACNYLFRRIWDRLKKRAKLCGSK